MIDALELSLPPNSLSLELRQAASVPGFYSTSTYRRRMDLTRLLGIPGFLNVDHRFNSGANHKQELPGCGTTPISFLEESVIRVSTAEFSDIKVVRLDCAVDIPDVTVDWFRQYSWIKEKRNTTEFRSQRHLDVTRGELVILSFGRKPNLLRIYDRSGLCRRKFEALKCVPGRTVSFEETYGFAANAIVTRLESRSCGRVVPESVRAFSNLRAAVDLQPFNALVIESSYYELVPRKKGYRVTDYLLAEQILGRIRVYGLHDTRAFLNRHSAGNASRIIARARASARQLEQPVPDLTALWRTSVMKQVKGACSSATTHTDSAASETTHDAMSESGD